MGTRQDIWNNVLKTTGQLQPTMSNESSPTKDEFRKIYMVCNYLIGVVFSEFKKNDIVATENEENL